MAVGRVRSFLAQIGCHGVNKVRFAKTLRRQPDSDAVYRVRMPSGCDSEACKKFGRDSAVQKVLLPGYTALVHLAHGGRDGPNPKPLCDDSLAADRVRASGRQHSVQDRHADGSLGLLGSETGVVQRRVTRGAGLTLSWRMMAP